MLEVVPVSDEEACGRPGRGNGVTTGRPVVTKALAEVDAEPVMNDTLPEDSNDEPYVGAADADFVDVETEVADAESSSVVVVMMTTVGTDTVVDEGWRWEKVKSGIEELGTKIASEDEETALRLPLSDEMDDAVSEDVDKDVELSIGITTSDDGTRA